MAGKKKRTENVPLLIPDVLDEDLSDAVIAVDDDIASVHSSRVQCTVDDTTDV